MTTNKKIEIVERFVNNLDWGTINKEIFSRIGLDNTSFFMKRKKVSFNMIFGEIQRLRKFYSDKLTIYDEKLKEHKKKYVEYLGNKQENSYKKQEHYKYKEQRLLHMMRYYSAKREFYNDIYDKIWSSKELIGIIYIARYSNIIREIKSIDKDVSLQLIIQGDLDSILKRKNIDGNKKFVSNRDILPCFEPFLKLSDIFYHYENLTSKQKMHIDIVLSIVFSKLTGIGIVFLDNRELFTIKNFVVLDEVKILKL